MEPFHHRRPSDPTAVVDSVRNTQAPLFREYERSTSPLAISYRLGINPPCVAQCSPSAESMSVAGHARSSLRRSCCAAYGAEFFLYEKMGRRAIVPTESTSGAETEVLHPIPPKRWESKGTRPLGGARGRASRSCPLRASRGLQQPYSSWSLLRVGVRFRSERPSVSRRVIPVRRGERVISSASARISNRIRSLQ